MRLALISLLSLYQRTLSPDHGVFRHSHPYGFCRFLPTCSEYARHAYMKYGLIRGTLLVIQRIVRCNPWSKGGIDCIM